jgi:tripartite-type tricarboxylate transporter receptor subunit TctC
VTRLNTELRKIIDSPEIKSRLASVGFEAFSSTPQQLGDTIRDELIKWKGMVKEAGLKSQ